jgi:hypothetical protein
VPQSAESGVRVVELLPAPLEAAGLWSNRRFFGVLKSSFWSLRLPRKNIAGWGNGARQPLLTHGAATTWLAGCEMQLVQLYLAVLPTHSAQLLAEYPTCLQRSV